jgi:hypothetical protein
MKLHADPLSRSYAEYPLRVGNGQESSIIDHFPPKANVKPLVEVEIALYPEIHQVPIFRYLHPRYFPGSGNQLRKTRIHGWSSYSDNKKYSRELSQHSDY